MFHSTATIENINDKEEVLATLSFFDDEDFNGNNGDEYLWEMDGDYHFMELEL